jgi:hypothetical protein
MQTLLQKSDRHGSSLSVILPRVFLVDCRFPLEFGGAVERKAAFPGVPPAFRIVEFDVCGFYCLPDKRIKQGLFV